MSSCCLFCGKPLIEGVQFCGACGEKILPSPENDPTTLETTPITQESSETVSSPTLNDSQRTATPTAVEDLAPATPDQALPVGTTLPQGEEGKNLRQTRLSPGNSIIKMVALVLLATIVVASGVAIISTGTLTDFSRSVQQQLITQSVPPTQISCPADGAARALIKAPMALVGDPSIIYATDEQSVHIKSYNTATKQTKDILKLRTGQIDRITLSPDQQWAVFSYKQQGQPFKLMMLRLDGQGLQTLFCTSEAITPFYISPDNQSLVYQTINQSTSANQNVFVNLQTGQVKNIITKSTLFGSPEYTPAGWLDATHLYLSREQDAFTGPISEKLLSILDVTKPTNQNDAIGLKDLAFSYTHAAILPNGQIATTSAIFKQDNSFQSGSMIIYNSNDSTQHTVIDQQPEVLREVYATDPDTLFYVVNNRNTNSLEDTEKNKADGIWKIKMDGSKSTMVASITSNINPTLLSQVAILYGDLLVPSPDGRFYAMTTLNDYGETIASYGSTEGGQRVVFSSGISNGPVTQAAGNQSTRYRLAPHPSQLLAGWSNL